MVKLDIVTPRKLLSIEERPSSGLTVAFEGWQVSLLSPPEVNIYHIILHVIGIIVNIISGFKTIQVNWVFALAVLCSIYSNSQLREVKIYCEPYEHFFCAVNIFLGISLIVKHYHPLPMFITCKGVVYELPDNIIASKPIKINYFTWKYNIALQ